METLAHAFGLPVGLSDHTPGIHIALAAVARGACIIEKHFTLNRSLPGPDQAASLEPAELTGMVKAIRDVEAALGDGIKRPTSAEWKNRPIARKSLVAARPIRTGEAFTEDNLGCKRPGDGRSPFDFWSILGTNAERPYDQDNAI
jgi:N-acetylneuraminate synthase